MLRIILIVLVFWCGVSSALQPPSPTPTKSAEKEPTKAEKATENSPAKQRGTPESPLFVQTITGPPNSSLHQEPQLVNPTAAIPARPKGRVGAHRFGRANVIGITKSGRPPSRRA